MLPKPMTILMLFVAVCTLGLGVMPSAVTPVSAAPEDVALFQEELARFGQWLTYGNHGMVWRPTQVDRNWRPYTNGRWAPTQEGYVFETDEPWGWATYHYGNWLPTNDHGWLWAPGRTWYPHTVNWRSNDENVGWSPVAPPDYLGAEGYASDGYAPTSGLGASGLLNALSPTSWMFTRASDFLQGYGQPYSSSYSYANAGVLASSQYVPNILERTVYVSNYVSPGYAPRACYNWGPPVTYITKVTNIKKIDIDYHMKGVRLANLRNVMPPASVAHRHPAWREVLPAHDDNRYRHIRSASHIKPGPGALNRPDAIPAPPALVRRVADGPGPQNQPGLLPPQVPLTQATAAVPQEPPVDRQSWRPPSEARSGIRPPARPSEQLSPRAVVNPPVASGPAKGLPYPAAANQVPPTAPPVGEAVRSQFPVNHTQRSYPAHRVQSRDELQPPRANKNGPPPALNQPPDRQQLEQQWRGRQQRLEMEQRQRQAMPEQQRFQNRQHQEMQMEQQRRQAESRRRQQMEQMQRHQQMQQQRQVEMQRQHQMQQQRQAEMQRQQQMQQQRHLEMQRQQQLQQQRQVEMRRQQHQQAQMARQAPPPPGQKKRDN